MNDYAATLLTKSREHYAKRRAAVEQFREGGNFDEDELRRLEVSAARAERDLQNVMGGLLNDWRAASAEPPPISDGASRPLMRSVAGGAGLSVPAYGQRHPHVDSRSLPTRVRYRPQLANYREASRE